MDKKDSNEDTLNQNKLNIRTNKYILEINHLILKYIYLILFLILVLITIFWNYTIFGMDTKLGIISIVFASIALLISIIIARNQDEQIVRIHEIADKTKRNGDEISKLLHSNSAIQMNRDNFFLLDKDTKYKLIFPVDYEGKTLPMVNAADSYTMHVLNYHLGVDSLDLMPIPRGSNDNYEKDLLGNTIIMCDVNPVLKHFFNKNESNENKIPNFNNLPCWFEEYETDNSYNNGKTLRIAINYKKGDFKLKLKSPSEQCCIDALNAYNLGKNKVFKSDKSVQTDLGILARVSQGEIKYIVIAGIHGYGTWITASFLNSLLNDKYINNPKYKTFFGRKDFIAITCGDFDTNKFSVERESLFENYLWAREGEEWIRA